MAAFFVFGATALRREMLLTKRPCGATVFPGFSSGKSERETADPVGALLSPEYQSGFYQADLPDS